MCSVAELFETVGKQLSDELGELFEHAAVQMCSVSGRPPGTAMRMALEEGSVSLEQEERNLLLELCLCLGRYDLEGQARAMQIYKSRLDELIEGKAAEQKQKAKAGMTAALCSGLTMIVILL